MRRGRSRREGLILEATPSEIVERLQKAIRELFGCDSRWVRAESVVETFEGKRVWEGTVEVFDLIGYSDASQCFAWITPLEPRERAYAVLRVPPITSAADAVRASIVRDFKNQ